MKKILFLCSIWAMSLQLIAQNSTFTPSAINSPRLEYDAILSLPNPTEGDLVYDLTFKCLRVFTGSRWICSYQDPLNFVPNSVLLASAGGNSYDAAQNIAVDASGDYYITGTFSGTTTFGATSITSAGSIDIFIAKYSGNGTLKWVKQAGGVSQDYGYSVALDNAGNVFVTGYFTGNVNFGGINKTSAGGSDIFIAKYNSNGVEQWVQSAGGSSNDSAIDICIDGAGDIIIAGVFGSDIFVSKYDNAGTLKWTQTAGGTGDDVAQGIAVDASKNIYITGIYANTATFGSLTPITSVGGYDIFIAKYDENGLIQWVRSAGGNASGGDSGYGIAVDNANNVFVTGNYSGTANFSTISKTSLSNSSDIFIAKYNSIGAVQWVQSAGGSSSDFGINVAIDNTGNAYITGTYSGTATFGTVSKSAMILNEAFIAKYNNNGVFQWVQSSVGSNSAIGYGIAVDNLRGIYTIGRYTGTITFGGTSKTSVGSEDMFMLKTER
jgi:hypothetical protein